MNEVKPATIDALKAELEIVELEERLEMVSPAAAVAAAAGNGVCCCSADA